VRDLLIVYVNINRWPGLPYPAHIIDNTQNEGKAKKCKKEEKKVGYWTSKTTSGEVD